MGSAPRVVDRLAAIIAHLFYRIDVVGEVPAKGPLLLLPNHPNALLDPAVVMATAGRPVRFLAKSTLFNGPLRLLLSAAGAIPVYRKQDGAETGRNAETFAAVAAALGRGDAVCIFPEGVSHSSGRLEALRTGAARMALAAVDAGVDLQLAAVGINLEQKTAFRSRATIAYGAPFLPTSAQSDPKASSPERVRRVTGEIALHMRALLVEADPTGDADLVDRVNRLYMAGRALPGDAAADLGRRKAIGDALLRVRAARPQFYDASLIQLRRYDDRLRRFGLADDTLDWEVSHRAALTFLAREIPIAMVLGPIAAAAIAAFVIPYTATAVAARITSETDVTATAKVVAGAVLYSGWLALIATVAWQRTGPWGAAAISLMLVGLAAAGLFAIERESAAWRTARSWLALRGARHQTRAALRRRRGELADLIDAVSDWIATTAPDEQSRVDHLG